MVRYPILLKRYQWPVILLCLKRLGQHLSQRLYLKELLVTKAVLTVNKLIKRVKLTISKVRKVVKELKSGTLIIMVMGVITMGIIGKEGEHFRGEEGEEGPGLDNSLVLIFCT